jgi:hypothetical protein
MKTWEEIKFEAESGDWERVASIAGCSRKTVEAVGRGIRTDNKNLQKIFSEMLTFREKLQAKYNCNVKGGVKIPTIKSSSAL